MPSPIPDWILLAGLAAALVAAGLISERGRLAMPRPRLHFPAPRPAAIPKPPVQLAADLPRQALEVRLFWLALAVYLATRWIGLADFPIYFFSDEADQTLLAADFVRDGLRSYDGELLPTYFKNFEKYNLGVSVYLQVLPTVLFGRAVEVTRGVSALVTVLAAAAVGLALRDVFRLPAWWGGVMLLSISPAWLLHSRTAFETAEMTAFYAAFLYCYLRYRDGAPRYLYGAVLFGALAFYTYSPAQVIMAVSLVLFGLADWRYHWQQRRTVLAGLLLAGLCALPYLRFRLSHPQETLDQLVWLDSYWTQPLPVGEKLVRLLQEYLQGISPFYWYLPHSQDLIRHTFGSYGHLWIGTLPLAVTGLVIVVRRLRQPGYRAALLALLATASGGALVEVGVTRVLSVVIPASLLAGIGLSAWLGWLAPRLRRISAEGLQAGAFLLLAAVNLFMLWDALTRGPTWFQNYGLHGMQYGARQVFQAIQAIQADHPQTHLVLSPDWANGTTALARYFMPTDPPQVELAGVAGFTSRFVAGLEDALLVLPPDDFERLKGSGKFTAITVEQTLPYPNGQPGFYFVRARYVDDIQATLERERLERSQPLEGEIQIDGAPVRVRYSRLDIGVIQQAFDGDPNSLCRTMEANPAVIDLQFSQPRLLSGLSIIIGSTEIQATLRATPADGGPPVVISRTLRGSVDAPQDGFDLDAALQISGLRLELRDLRQGEPGNVHFWEISLR
jgi:hypothetical protein